MEAARRTGRQSNYELLRIVLMVMIVFGHMIGQSGGLDHTTNDSNFVFNYLFGRFPRIAVNGFVILSCYFLVDGSFRGGRLVSVWCTELIYTAPITVGMYFLGVCGASAVLHGFLPIFGWNHWYVSTYLVFLFIVPFLRKFAGSLSEKGLRGISIVILVFILLWNTVHRFEDTTMDCFIWFMAVYFLMFYYKRHLAEKIKGKWRWLLLALGIQACMIGLVMLSKKIQITNPLVEKIVATAARCLTDYKTIPNFLVAMGLFVFFSKVKIRQSKTVNVIASSALAVYIFHQIPAFYDFLWKRILHADAFINRGIWPLYVVASTLGILACVMLFELLRKVLERKFLLLRPVRWIVDALDVFYRQMALTDEVHTR